MDGIVTDDGDRATPDWLRAKLRDALGSLTAVQTTGDERRDADLLAAEQAIRRVIAATK